MRHKLQIVSALRLENLHHPFIDFLVIFVLDAFEILHPYGHLRERLLLIDYDSAYFVVALALVPDEAEQKSLPHAIDLVATAINEAPAVLIGLVLPHWLNIGLKEKDLTSLVQRRGPNNVLIGIPEVFSLIERR